MNVHDKESFSHYWKFITEVLVQNIDERVEQGRSFTTLSLSDEFLRVFQSNVIHTRRFLNRCSHLKYSKTNINTIKCFHNGTRGLSKDTGKQYTRMECKSQRRVATAEFQNFSHFKNKPRSCLIVWLRCLTVCEIENAYFCQFLILLGYKISVIRYLKNFFYQHRSTWTRKSQLYFGINNVYTKW